MEKAPSAILTWIDVPAVAITLLPPPILETYNNCPLSAEIDGSAPPIRHVVMNL